MTTFETPGLLTFTLSIIVFFIGRGLNSLIGPLRRWNIPEAVTGGLLAALVTLFAYEALGFKIVFDLDARDMLLLYFFTGVGLNAKLGDLISGGRPLAVLLALTMAPRLRRSSSCLSSPLSSSTLPMRWRSAGWSGDVSGLGLGGEEIEPQSFR